MDIICDLDGTLADLTHRLHYVRGPGKKNWPAFLNNCDKDAVIEPIRDVIFSLYGSHRVFFCSGRNEAQRAMTRYWLRETALLWDPGEKGIYQHTGLFMRADGDYRADYLVKSDLLDHMLSLGINPGLVFDDRQQVVDMWRRRGYRVCQVAEGDF